MKPRYKVSRAGIELIKSFEGYRRSAAQLADGRWTIGYGHTKTARQGAEVSEDDAAALLFYDLIEVSAAVNDLTFTPLTQNQFDALVSFASNVGVDSFHKSMVLRRVNEGSMLQAAGSLEMWRKADFEGEQIVVDALVRRRAAEKSLFLTPPDGWVAAPSPVLPPKFDAEGGANIPATRPVELTASLVGAVATVERGPVESQPVQPAAEPALAVVTDPIAEVAAEPIAERPSAPEPETVVASLPTAETLTFPSMTELSGATPISQVSDASQLVSARLEAILPGVALSTSLPDRRNDLDLPTAPDTETEAFAEAPIESVSAASVSTAEPELFERPRTELPWSNPIAYSAPQVVEHEDEHEQHEPVPALADLFQRPIYREQALDDGLPFSSEDVQPAKLGFAPYLLTAVLGLIVVAAAVTWALSARSTGGHMSPMVMGLPFAFVGVVMVAWSVYSLISRLSGRED